MENFVEHYTNENKLLILHYNPRKLIYQFNQQLCLTLMYRFSFGKNLVFDPKDFFNKSVSHCVYYLYVDNEKTSKGY